jgi:hypothetical protein
MLTLTSEDISVMMAIIAVIDPTTLDGDEKDRILSVVYKIRSAVKVDHETNDITVPPFTIRREV